MKRISVHSTFSNQWFNFDPNIDFPVCAFGVGSDPNTTTNAKPITLSMCQERYVMGDDLAFNITPRSQFTKIKFL